MATFCEMDGLSIRRGTSIPDDQAHRANDYLAEVGMPGNWIPFDPSMVSPPPVPMPQIRDDILAVSWDGQRWLQQERQGL